MKNRLSPEKVSLSSTAYSTTDHVQNSNYTTSKMSSLTQRTNPVKELEPEMQEDPEKPLLSNIDLLIEEEGEEEEDDEEREEEPAGSVVVTGKVILSGFLWSFCSCSMVLVNKSLASRCVCFKRL